MYGQFDGYFESLSQLMTNDVVFPNDESEYELSLANGPGGPNEPSKGGKNSQNPAQIGAPTPATFTTPAPTSGPSNLAGIEAALQGSRELLIDMLLQNSSFEECNITA
jgi:hypothetical protein